VKDLQESVDVSLIRYRGGTANYLESQRSLFQAELTLAQARNNEYQREPGSALQSRIHCERAVDRIPFPLPERPGTGRGSEPMSNDDKPIGVATALTIGSFALIGLQ
jgi:hypothetical protein